eukprot:UN00001
MPSSRPSITGPVFMIKMNKPSDGSEDTNALILSVADIYDVYPSEINADAKYNTNGFISVNFDGDFMVNDDMIVDMIAESFGIHPMYVEAQYNEESDR